MRLYRFLNAENGLRSVRERRLRIGRIEELNDDFEFLGIALDLKADRIALRRMRKQISETKGVICMSANWSSPLMWAHYADSHKGMVLGFDVPAGTFTKVEYVLDRPTLASMGLSKFGAITEPQMSRLITMKAKGWEYEHEYRAFTHLRDGVDINGQVHFFFPIGPGMTLREVIVGSRFEAERAVVTSAVEGLEGVEVFMARGDFKKFEVVRQHQDSMWL